ncbi:MAG: hypothetical protein H6822_17390 [Planctomycetaceae bacterium]|nr:hypothetical protein [Planctomycetales bacterium]MCB9923960.1 hypothetical protein [Planctomycetaceae bacterium]
MSKRSLISIQDLSWRVLRSFLAASVAFVLLGIFTQDKTLASCGDYLSMSNEGHSPAASHMDEGDASAGLPAKQTCQGPQCRQQPAAPIRPQPSTSGGGQHEQAHLQRLSDFTLPSPFSHLTTETSARLWRGFPSRLDRPPRG